MTQKPLTQILYDLGNTKQAFDLWGIYQNNIYLFSKEDIKTIRESVIKTDREIEDKYIEHKKEYIEIDRPALKELINRWVYAYRSYSLYID